MIPLFGDSMADGKRWVLEGRLISVALQRWRLGTSVVLDYGLWGRDERSALRWLAGVGHLVYPQVAGNKERRVHRVVAAGGHLEVQGEAVYVPSRGESHSVLRCNIDAVVVEAELSGVHREVAGRASCVRGGRDAQAGRRRVSTVKIV
ncbi:hypothetical protein [Streptomyces sp. NPDC005799]|uniref:hypothetical protein n=1 Tax=Streptomyces sp. NPDC005799 TaxID=3154678 RepID=UPI0033E09D00